MSAQVFNLAVIGCGRIANHHFDAIRNHPNLKLLAASDLDEEKAKIYGHKLDVPYFTDYRKMLSERPEIQIVIIATPSGMHFEHALEMIVRYNKSVVVEKPTVLKHEELTKLYEAAIENKVNVFPVFQNRYNKAVQRVKKALETDELGKIVHASVRVRWCRPQRYYDLSPWRGTYAMDGGALTNQGIHHVDLLRYLGGEVKELSCKMKTLGASIEVEDTVAAALEFQGGATGSLEVTTAARPHDFEASISLVCEKGIAQLGGIAVNELQMFTPNPEDCPLFSEDFSGCVYGNGHFELYKDLASSLLGQKDFPISQLDCTNTMKLLHTFYVAAETQKWESPQSELTSKNLGKESEVLADLYRTLPKWRAAP
jgi:UDP-N-acetyl-2-amino-2-deoxyglucuronate dehydrogenase